VDDDELGVIRDVFKSHGDRFLAGRSAFDYSNGLAKFFLLAEILQARNLVGASGEDDVSYGFAGCQAAEGMQEDWRPIEFKELFGRLPAHAGTHACGREDGGDSTHIRR
jgi:hypothetical protein